MFPYLTTGFISTDGARISEVARFYLRVTDMVLAIIRCRIFFIPVCYPKI